MGGEVEAARAKVSEASDPNMTILDTGHSDQIHDSQVDYFGKKLATCSSDGTIKIFSLNDKSVRLLATLTSHKGPVWRVAWAHPKFGVLLASCSFDGTAKVWKQEGDTWWTIWDNKVHSTSVNSVSWAPHEYGLILASGGSDGKVAICTCKGIGSASLRKHRACVTDIGLKGETWDVDCFMAHDIGCCAVAWAPPDATTTQTSPGTYSEEDSKMSIATGGCDNLVKIWMNVNGQWVNDACLRRHKGWIRDVCFSPNVGAKTKYLASCSEDKSVFIWKKKASQKAWTTVPLKSSPFQDTVWRLSWSTFGNLLAVAYGDSSVSLWKEALNGSWAELKSFC